MTETPEDPLKDVTKPDGSLYSLGWYLSWEVGDPLAVLDGDFSADDLIAIGFHMKRTLKCPKPL